MDTNPINPIITKMIEFEKNNPCTAKERAKIRKERKKRHSSPEYIDRYIYSIEHDFVKDGIRDWNGCNINESWEKYKEKVGYYKRHPERKEESQAFTKAIMQWWDSYTRELNDEQK